MENTSVSTPSNGSDSSGSEGVSTEALNTDAKAAAPESMDDLVEIALGSTKAKLPRAIADQIKNLERGAQKAFQDGAQAKKQLKDFESAAKTNPKGFLQKFGIDPYDFAEMTLAEKLEVMSMSPEQRELADLKREKADRDEAEKLAQAEREKEHFSRQEIQLQEQYDVEIAEAFRNSGLPKHKFYVQQIAAEMLGAEKRNESLSAADAASRVKKRTQAQIRDLFETMDPQGIQELLSDSVRKKLREFEVQKVTANAAPTPDSGKRPGKSPASEPKRDSSKPMPEKEWKKYIESLKS